MVEKGAIRLTHNGAQSRLDKPSRSVHPGDEVLFAQGGRLIAMGEKRGPPEEARALYEPLDAPT
ncbi:hypothetical protein LTR94_038047 [Friedmanniomyces endolithicus]|nr:hypothetical protein LTR94_038047 [Friedmanniomyces endolithicus]